MKNRYDRYTAAQHERIERDAREQLAAIRRKLRAQREEARRESDEDIAWACWHFGQLKGK